MGMMEGFFDKRKKYTGKIIRILFYRVLILHLGKEFGKKIFHWDLALALDYLWAGIYRIHFKNWKESGVSWANWKGKFSGIFTGKVLEPFFHGDFGSHYFWSNRGLTGVKFGVLALIFKFP